LGGEAVTTFHRLADGIDPAVPFLLTSPEKPTFLNPALETL
jgi:hypothetical protein